MKFLSSQVTYLLSRAENRQNIAALAKYLAFLIGVIVLFTILFHFLMIYEGQEHSWLSGLYWVLVVMSTLGFGDITFSTDLGRAFSVLVLLSGVVLLLIMLPFTFIRFFYAPWLEAQLHTRTPREVPEGTSGHVIICGYESIAPNLIKRLKQEGIRYFVVESDPARAAQMLQDGITVIQGEVDSRNAYERMNVRKAALVFANRDDATNTNITLTVREAAPDVVVAATATDPDSIDILELTGATHVLPLKQRLGEYLANRISVGDVRTHEIGTFGKWVVVEFTVHNTSLENKLIRETGLREKAGVSIIGIWRRGMLVAADPDDRLAEFDVPLAVGTREQIAELEKLLKLEKPTSHSVLILGGGKVGRAAAIALKEKGLTVYMVEREKNRCDSIRPYLDRLTIGDAADRDTLMTGGLMESSLVLLTTNDDAVNIYLSIYCRRLNPDVRIISRVEYVRNVEAIHRAGADFVLSYAPLGAESVMSILQGRPPMIMGEGVELFVQKVPDKLVGKTLAASGIGSKTGLIVLAVENNGDTNANPTPETVLPAGAKLDLLGTSEQMQAFEKVFE
ncbi:MAG: NAD-binding protein [Acidobacteria bacterium]|nr:NAD-binding protein [Acidobacteriota bacterium]